MATVVKVVVKEDIDEVAEPWFVAVMDVVVGPIDWFELLVKIVWVELVSDAVAFGLITEVLVPATGEEPNA